MPPAFNLSQDQTLQFNHCKVLTRLTYYCQCEHFILLEIPLLTLTEIRARRWHSQNQVPTPIGCKLLKSVRAETPDEEKRSTPFAHPVSLRRTFARRSAWGARGGLAPSYVELVAGIGFE